MAWLGSDRKGSQQRAKVTNTVTPILTNRKSLHEESHNTDTQVSSEKQGFKYTISNEIRKKLIHKTLAISTLTAACSISMSMSARNPQTISNTHCLQDLNLGFDPCIEECSESHASAESLQCRSGYLVSCNCEAAG